MSRAGSTDPFEDPIIQPNYLTEPMDQRVLVKGMHLARSLLHTKALAPFFDRDELPGPEVRTDDEWLDYARRFGSTAYHLIGTARMGPATDKSRWSVTNCWYTGCRGCGWWMPRSCPTCRPPTPTVRR